MYSIVDITASSQTHQTAFLPERMCLSRQLGEFQSDSRYTDYFLFAIDKGRGKEGGAAPWQMLLTCRGIPSYPVLSQFVAHPPCPYELARWTRRRGNNDDREQEIDMTAKTAKRNLYGMTSAASIRNSDSPRDLQSQGGGNDHFSAVLQPILSAFLLLFPLLHPTTTRNSASQFTFRVLLTAYTNMSTTPAPPNRPPTAAPARSTTPGTTPAHPPPSTTGAQQSNKPSTVPRAIPAGIKPIDLTAQERHTSQAPSEGSHVSEHGALALVHQPSTAYRMNMGVEQVREGSEIRVIKQVQQVQYRGVAMGAGKGAAGQKEVVHEVSPPCSRKGGRKEGHKYPRAITNDSGDVT